MVATHPEDLEATKDALTAVTHPEESKKATAVPQLTDQTNLLPFKSVVVVFAALALCTVVSRIDSAITATALPTISAAFNVGSVISWVPSAYMLTSTSFQPLYGRFSDIFGRKPTICLAISVFTLGCLISGFSKDFIELVVWRGIAGVGGGAIRSLAQIIISDVTNAPLFRGKYQGIISIVSATGYAIGPLIGGALSEKVSWRWCFWVNVPVSLIAICIVVFVLPLKPVEGDVKRKLSAVDYFGAGLSLCGSALVILPLIWGGVTYPWNSPVIIALLCSGVLVTVIFCFWEWKGARLPIIPMYIFRHTTVNGVYIAMFANGFIFFSSMYYLPQFFEIALESSSIHSGVLLSPLLVSQPVASWLAGVIVSRTGRYRMIVYIGFSTWAVGCGCISTVNKSTPKGFVVLYTLLAGIGAGQTLQTTTVAAQASVQRKDVSVVTSVRNFARQMGGALSLAIGSTLINNFLRRALASLNLTPSAIKSIIDKPALLGSRTPQSELALLGLDPARAAYALTDGYMWGFRWVFVLNACLAGFATLTSILMIKHEELVRGDEEKLRKEASQFLESHKTRELSGAGEGERNETTISMSEKGV